MCLRQEKSPVVKKPVPVPPEEVDERVSVLASYLLRVLDLLLIDDVNDRVEKSQVLSAQFQREINAIK